MVLINVDSLLKRQNKSKYWLCKEMNITTRNLNRIINRETNSISFRYIQEFCKLLNSTPADLITILDDDEEKQA